MADSNVLVAYRYEPREYVPTLDGSLQDHQPSYHTDITEDVGDWLISHRRDPGNIFILSVVPLTEYQAKSGQIPIRPHNRT